MGKVVFFSANDEVHGTELWVTDGTEAGTRMVKDIQPDNSLPDGWKGSDVSDIAALGDGRVVFSAVDVNFAGRRELWVSDGTEDGTALLRDINPDASSGPIGQTALGDGRVVFAAKSGTDLGYELWITDGTAVGTQLVKDINPTNGNVFDSHIGNFMPVGFNRVVFTANDGVHGTEFWVTDGTPEGTLLLADMSPGGTGLDSQTNVVNLSYEELVGGRLYINVYYDGERHDWVTDGTPDGTQPLVDGEALLGPTATSSSFELLPDGQFIFTVYSEHGQFKYLSDGTLQGTELFGYYGGASDAPRPVEFQLETDEGKHPRQAYDVYWDRGQQLGDGRVLYSANTYEIKTETLSIGTTYERGIDYGSQLWVSDGTQSGTHLVRAFDGEEDPQLQNPDDFFTLPDGRVLFTARSEDDIESLYVTDGTDGGTILLATGIDDASYYTPWGSGGVVLFEAYEGVWRTDGTPEGTQFLIPDLDMPTLRHAIEIDNGEVLLTPGSYTPELWLVDAEATSARKIAHDVNVFYLDTPLSLGGGKYLLDSGVQQTGQGEPWLLNTEAGTFELLKDINPGADPSGFANAVVVTPPGEIPIPVSTLFPVRVNLEEEVSAFDLDDYFTDPEGGTLSYAVTGAPDEITVNSATGVITASEDVAAGDYAITITASTAKGGTVTSSLDWSVIDTGKLTIATTGDWEREVADGPITSTLGAVITIGRKDGTAQLFRIEPLDPAVPGGTTKSVAKIEHGKITLEGKLFSEQVSTTKPLMEGKFTIDMAKVEVSNFEDANSNTDYRMVADLVDFTFRDINIGTDKISFQTDLAFDDGGGTGPSYDALSTKNAPLALSFGADGLGFGASVGTERWSPDPIEFDLGAGSSIGIGFSDLGVDYEAAADAIYVNGKATVSWGGAIENGFNFLDNDSESSLTIDLFGQAQQNNFFQRGDKYLKITNAPTGWDWDVVGEIKYEDKYEGSIPTSGFLVKELVVGFDTIQDRYSGSFKANIPLLWGVDLSAGVGFVKNPDLKLDSISIGVDKINYPIGTTGLFVQGGTLGLENLAAADPTAGWTYKAEITGTFGPDNDLVKSPLHGKIAGTIKETLAAKKIGYVLTGTVELDSKVGYLVPDVVNELATPLIDYFGVNPSDVTNFELIKATSTTQLDLTKDRGQYDTTISLLGGVVRGAAQVINAPNATVKDARDMSASVSASLIIPDAFPLVGGMTRSGNAIVQYSSDGRDDNDLTAFWSQITIPLGFTERIYAFGAQLRMDGEYKFLGRKDIPKISSWALDEDDELVILTARWETDDLTAEIEVITPEGVVLNETAIAARDDITLIEDLNTATSRHVALKDPDAGVWDLQLASPAGLGEITYEANEMLASAIAPIESLTPDDAQHEATIVIDVDTGDSDTVDVVIFAASDTGHVTGVELARETVSADDPTLTHTFGYERLGPGEWHIYTRTSADGLAPVVQMHPTPITVSGAADLATTARQATHSPTGAQVMTVTVANEGDRPSLPGILAIDVPAEMVGGPAVPVLGAEPLTATENDISLPVLAPGETFTVRISLPSGTEDLENAIFIDAWTPGVDADPTDNTLGQVLHVSRLENVDQYLSGTDGSDVLIGDGGNDTLLGGNGDDYLLPGAGADSVEGGNGISDMLGVGYTTGQQPDQALIVDLELGQSTNDGFGSIDIINDVEDVLGTSFGDTILGDAMPNLLVGAHGNDVIDGRGAGDLIWGGAGNDTLTGGVGSDLLIFATASSRLFSDAFRETFPALLFGDRGAIANLSTGLVTDEFGDTDTISGFENVIGSDFGDHFTGTAFDNYFIGEDGDDTLLGQGGDDTLEGDDGADSLDGGDGNDRLEGSKGDDTINGGDGADYAAYFNAAAGVMVDLSQGLAVDDGDGGSDVLIGIENLFGSLFDDSLLGDANDNTFTGLDGDDLIDGGGGLDTVYYGNASSAVTVDLQNEIASGGEGNDTLISIELVDGSEFGDTILGDDDASLLDGLGGNDTINGRGGTDWLLGSGGDDVLDGGTGIDTAVFDGPQSAFTLTLSPDRVTITDRQSVGQDTDTLISIEFLDFDQNIDLFGDNPMDLDIFSGPAGLSAAEFGAIIELYIAYFNRAPDALGLLYWGTRYAEGHPLS
ncbi:hypothetical protein JQT63_19360, partial [Sulfitobacter mediterraneus]